MSGTEGVLIYLLTEADTYGLKWAEAKLIEPFKKANRGRCKWSFRVVEASNDHTTHVLRLVCVQ